MREVILTLTLVLVGCATSAIAGQTEYEKAVTGAKVAQKQAAAVGGEWRDVGKLIKDAEAAAAKKEYDTALNLAVEAKAQSELGYTQAISQRHAGFPTYVK